ncbi:unnamed protein product [Penicillium viridicatum]
MTINAMPIVRSMPRITIRNTSCNPPLATFYARFATQSSKVSNPVASSPESQGIDKSRGLEGRHSDTPDLHSAQSPISSSKKPERGSETLKVGEQTSTDAQIKNDPSMSTKAKRKNVEKAGQKPMGPEDR